jgi:hypothetical protein
MLSWQLMYKSVAVFRNSSSLSGNMLLLVVPVRVPSRFPVHPAG